MGTTQSSLSKKTIKKNKPAETLAARLLRLRVEKHLTRIDLAAAAGVSQGALQLIEKGVTRKPSSSVANRIAEALEVEASYLLTGELGA